MSAAYFFPFFLLFVASGCFFGCLERRPSTGLRDGVDLPRSMAGFCFTRRTLAARTPVLSDQQPLFRKPSSGNRLASAICTFVQRFSRGWTRRCYALASAALVLLAAISLLAFVPVFNCCTKEMCHYDLGLYYLKTIRWTESFPIVRGLVNVQPYLGLNRSAYLVTSFFDSLVPHRRGLPLIDGILPWLGLSLSLFAMVRIALLRFLRNESVRPSLRWPTPSPCQLGFSRLSGG